jgi:hypothetical protein
LLAALKAGHYYSSTGPEIHSIQLETDRVTIRCSPVSKVLVTGSIPGKQVRDGQNLAACSLSLEMLQASSYIRVTVADAAGKRAWSNPIWLH